MLQKGLCINSDLIDKGTTQFSDILTGAQGASWKASTLFGGRRPLLKDPSSLKGERTTWGWPQGSCQGSRNPPPGSGRWEENGQSLQWLPTRDDAVQVLTPLPTLPAASSPPASLPKPPFPGKRTPPRTPPAGARLSVSKPPILSEKLHRVRAQAGETRAFPCKPHSHLSSPGPEGVLPCLFRVFLRHHQVYLSACPEASSVPAHRATLSSHALASCAILGKLTSLGLGFFHDSEDLPPP